VQCCVSVTNLGNVNIFLDELAADNLVCFLATIAVEQGIILLVDGRLLLLLLPTLQILKQSRINSRQCKKKQ
jgi:hypothetical protein